MLLSEHASNIDVVFAKGRHSKININYISQSYFHLPRKTFRNISNINILYKQILRAIILLFHDMAGSNRNLQEWKQVCRRAWENEYDYLQKDIFAKTAGSNCTIRNCDKTKYIESTHQTKTF